MMIQTLIVMFLLPTAVLAVPGPGGGTPVSQAEIDGLLWMREEEKLARDAYNVFFEQYHMQIFANIAASEQQHMDAILTLLNRYGIPDPAAGSDPGEFTNPDLQALYDQLVAQGAASLQAAYEVGVTIEMTDIDDLNERLAAVTHRDIREVYLNLKTASQNHLRAFQRQLPGVAGARPGRGFGLTELLAGRGVVRAGNMGRMQGCRAGNCGQCWGCRAATDGRGNRGQHRSGRNRAA
jgi:hypothetical protein